MSKDKLKMQKFYGGPNIILSSKRHGIKDITVPDKKQQGIQNIIKSDLNKAYFVLKTEFGI